MAAKTKHQKVGAAAVDPDFQARIRLALIRIALAEVGCDNSARAAYAKQVLAGQINLPAAALAVLSNASIMDSVANAAEGDMTFGVADDAIAFAVAENDDPAKGVFHKLSLANAGPQ